MFSAGTPPNRVYEEEKPGPYSAKGPIKRTKHTDPCSGSRKLESGGFQKTRPCQSTKS